MRQRRLARLPPAGSDAKEGAVIDKVIGSPADAVCDIESGSVIGIGGFGVTHGFPLHLITAVRDRGLTDLVIVCNSLGAQPTHRVTLVEHGQARKLVAGLPTLVSDHLAGRDIMLHAEDGLLGYASRLTPAEADDDVYNADDVRQLTAAPLVVELWAEMTDTTRSRHVAWRAEFRPGGRAAA